MKKILTFVLGFIVMISLFDNKVKADETKLPATIYGFSFHELHNGEEFTLEKFAGKAMLIVNTASKCGFTGQYEGLEKLYQQYKDRDFIILGVPSNDFGGQKPGKNEEIAEFCKLNYGVTFPMAEKIHISGDNAHPFYGYAKKKLGFGTAPKWNFHKYLISKDGELVDYFHSTTAPDSKKLIEAIERQL